MICSWKPNCRHFEEAKYHVSVWDGIDRFVAAVKNVCPPHADYVKDTARQMGFTSTALWLMPEIPEELC